MKIKIIALLVLLAPTLSGADTLEPLFGYLSDLNGITFQVFSGGCTRKEDFAIRKEQANGKLRIGLYRTRTDNCFALYSHGIFLDFTYQELGIENNEYFRIFNPLVDLRSSRY